jgi:hypothetical protein
MGCINVEKKKESRMSVASYRKDVKVAMAHGIVPQGHVSPQTK